MKIVSCCSDLKEIKPLAAAGASELYCAVKPLLSFGEAASLADISEFRHAARRAHDLGLKISVAVNALRLKCNVSEAQRMAAVCAEADQAGADAFIISNLSALKIFSDYGFKPKAALHLSSVQPCFSSAAAAFFIRLGFSRLIFPNQLAPREAGALMKLCRKKKIETEIFDYRFFGCAYINGRCHLHLPEFYTLRSRRPEGSLCRVNIPVGKRLKLIDLAKGEANAALARTAARVLSARLACGGAPRMANAAAFYDFFTAGVDFLKYGTREDSLAVKVRKVGQLRDMLKLAEKISGDLGAVKAKDVFIEKMTAWKGS
jgi:hypothetical protein